MYIMETTFLKKTKTIRSFLLLLLLFLWKNLSKNQANGHLSKNK